MLDFTKKNMLEIPVKVSENDTLNLGFERTTAFEVEMQNATKELEIYMFNKLKMNPNLSKIASADTENTEQKIALLSESDIDIHELSAKTNESSDKQLETIRKKYTFKDAQEQYQDITKEQYELVIKELYNTYVNEKK